MRILLTTHVFFPEYSSGTEILALSSALELQKLGHDIEICTGFPTPIKVSDDQRFDCYLYKGIQVRRFLHNSTQMGDQTNIVEAEYNNAFFARWFHDYLLQFKPDVVHFFHLGLLSASTIDVCHALGIPMVMTPTDFWIICPNAQLRLPSNSLCKGPDEDSVNCIKHAVSNSQHKAVAAAFNRFPRWLIASMIRGVNHGYFSRLWFSPFVIALSERAAFLRNRMNKLDRVIVPTKLMQELLIANGLDQRKVVFSHFGITPIPTQPHVEDNERMRIGFIGGLSEHKGAHLLIGAANLLPPSVSFELRIYGRNDTHPDYFKWLQQLAGADNRIQFRGTFPNDAIAAIFSELDVLVVPSIWYENTPLVIYSAQAHGCPVIASNLKGMSEIIQHEQNGLLFEVGNTRELANTIERLALNRPLLQRLADGAVKPKPISKYVSQMLDIYSEVILTRQNKIESYSTLG
jgi:glycosyltransferase involved in cell wall biosynthesis